MERNMNGHTIELLTGDITKQKTDAIVNAANGTLLGGGGVDGAIHKAAGKELVAECKQVREEELDGAELATGEAVMTGGYNLPSSHVIHTVGPVWGGDESEKERLLANCYRNALNIAAAENMDSICFPSISTGVYRFPVERAASVAIHTIITFLDELDKPMHVKMVLFSEKDYETYAKALEEACDSQT